MSETDHASETDRAATAEETSDVRRFWQALGLPGLIDVHTHFMPHRLLDRIRAYFDAAGPLIGREWPIRYRQDEEQRLEILRGFGLRAFTSLAYPHKPGMAESLNAWTADFAARTPDCLHSATFFPEPEAVVYVPAAIEAGARVFKAHIQVGDYDPADPLLDAVWGSLAEAGVPAIAHCGSGPVATRFTGPAAMAPVLAAHPTLRLVVAHFGMPEYVEFLDLAERYDGVLFDTTMAFTDFFGRVELPDRERKRIAELEERILFGSDFPNIPYSYTQALEALSRLDFGDDWLCAVCYGNAARIFGV
ncbi:amidohydrolase family protein [Catenulispora rubra]|uniref:amidohydrolase family protein n=1 Tax=Catenulispora rubra TaxID=280293 RepID=UPI00189212ED|nr:amidohydrolase family protein [Catenulispora rubra]